MNLQDIMSTQNLFFEAKQLNIENNFFRVVGKPFGPESTEFQYKALRRPWRFSNYETVFYACIGWAEALFETELGDLHVFQFNCPYNKANFMLKIGSMQKSWRMGDELFHPFLVIEYGYDHPTKIHLKLGFSRFACVNGLITGYQDASELVIDISHIGKPIALNPCYLKQYGKVILQKIKWLKNMPLPVEEWMVPAHMDDLKSIYARELGGNVWAYLNVLSEHATHHPNAENHTLRVEREATIQARPNRREQYTPNASIRLQGQVGNMFESFAQLAISSLEDKFSPDDYRKMAFFQENQESETLSEDHKNALKEIDPIFYTILIDASPFMPKRNM